MPARATETRRRPALVRILRVLLLLGVVLGGGWWVMSLSYDDEQPRIQAGEGPASVGPLMDKVSRFYADNHRLPKLGTDIEDYGIVPEPHVADVRVSPDDMIITITYKGRREIEGKSLILAPHADARGDLKWSCTLKDVDPRWWPDYCRH